MSTMAPELTSVARLFSSLTRTALGWRVMQKPSCYYKDSYLTLFHEG